MATLETKEYDVNPDIARSWIANEGDQNSFESLNTYLTFTAKAADVEADNRPKTAFEEFQAAFGTKTAEAMEATAQAFISLYLYGEMIRRCADTADVAAAYVGRRLWEDRIIADVDIAQVQKLFLAYKCGMEYGIDRISKAINNDR